jgi:carboxypeptidase C (cathepsin A)
MLTIRILLLAALLAGAAPFARAEDPPPAKPAEEKSAKPDRTELTGVLALLPDDQVTRHSLTLAGQSLSYTATAGTLALRDDKGARTASVFYTAYTMPAADPKTRAVSFFFNGGPGAASAFLHLGAAGPVVLQFPAIETDGVDAKLVDNPDTWLPFSDLVFIDAVGTGWSRPAKPEAAAEEFWGVRQDAAACAKTVALWLAKNGRTASPKYLVGESYGGLRAIKTARDLQNAQGVLVNGIVMISPLIEWPFLEDTDDNPVADALHLPSFIAAAAERRHNFEPQLMDAFYSYALSEYLTTIVGPPLDGDAAKTFYAKLADLTDLPAPVIARHRGRLDPGARDIRTDDGKLRSVYDFTIATSDPYPEGGGPFLDPLLHGYARAYGSAMTGYAAESLGFRTELTYELLADDVSKKWDQHNDGSGALDDLRQLLALDPTLHVLVAHGWFDVLTPFGVSRFLVDHLPVGRERVSLKTYPGGHMLYIRPASRAAFAKDVNALFAFVGK